MLDITDRGPVRVLRLQRPPVNALDPALITALRSAVETAPRDGARALLLAGTPGRFSGGLDLRVLLGLDREALRPVWQDFFELMAGLATSPIPVAAAMTGHAPAGGTVLGIFCDYRVLAEGGFKVGLNEVQVGLPLPHPIYRAFERLIGPRIAERMAVEGTLIEPAEALAIGLVDELAPVDEVEARAEAWCRRVVDLPPSAFEQTRRRARQPLAGYFSTGAAREQEVEGLLDAWFGDECQRTLRGVLAALGGRKS
ncbi:MAG: enoyl-CoA hydratase/isomerase family protein [Acidobacteria bacterium]|nr:enoyl-CoA hydratase/isomerase family protein [Acidobacteriota bacterium]